MDTCVKAGGARIGTHDAIARIWVALLAAAGFLDIEYEPRRWDAEAVRSAYAIVPNTLLATWTVHDLQECRQESPAIDHAVEVSGESSKLVGQFLQETNYSSAVK